VAVASRLSGLCVGLGCIPGAAIRRACAEYWWRAAAMHQMGDAGAITALAGGGVRGSVRCGAVLSGGPRQVLAYAVMLA